MTVATGAAARKAATSLRRGSLTAGALPALLDGLAEVGENRLPAARRAYDEYSQLEAYANGEASTPGPALLEMAEACAISVDELARRWQTRAAVDHDTAETEVRTAAAIYAGYQLTAYSTTDRHAYYCTDDMTAVVRSAAGSVADLQVSFTAPDLPSPHGVAYFADADRPTVMRWCTVDGATTVNLARLDGLATLMDDWRERHEQNHVAQPLEQISFSPAESDEKPHIDIRRVSLAGDSPITSNDAATTLIAFSRLIQHERSADVGSEVIRSRITDRKGRTRSRQDTINYIRAARRTTRSDTDTTTREYSHRWVVRGHWRRQWYPTQNRHIPIWITDRIAGPDDKPIRHRDKVTIV